MARRGDKVVNESVDGHRFGSDNSHCSLCGCKFKSTYGFDRHQQMVGDETRCIDPEQIGMTQDRRGYYRYAYDFKHISAA